MLKSFRLSRAVIFCFFLTMGINAAADTTSTSASAASCHGRFPNPITDVCWLCMFPIRIGAAAFTAGQSDNGDPAPPTLCKCPAPPPLFIRYGIGISYWEPARLAEVVRTPMCSPTLGGKILGKTVAPAGSNFSGTETGEAFYHVHWLQYPVLQWVGMAISSGACAVSETFDVMYMTEMDALWDDDELSFMLNPEAVLFSTPITQAACVADSVKAAVTKFGIDALFWCSGTTGSVYPFDGQHASHVGGIDSSLNLVHRFVFKMHRQLLAQDTSTYGAMCGNVPQPIMRKNQYKEQMMYPIPQTKDGYGFGAFSGFWAAGKEFPYKGEDFTYLVWRKRQCCAF